MSEISQISASLRERAGKGAARAARREGFVPAVIYGDKKDPVMIKIEARALRKMVESSAFFTNLVDVELDGKKHRVLPRDVALHPVTMQPEHVDFLRVSRSTTVTVAVPVTFINEDQSPGLSEGGVLNVVRYEIELICNAANIPEGLECDLSGAGLGDSIHISQMNLPDDVELTITDRDFTVATIAAPSAVKAEAEEAAAEAAEGEEGAEEAAGEAEAQEE